MPDNERDQAINLSPVIEVLSKNRHNGCSCCCSKCWQNIAFDLADEGLLRSGGDTGQTFRTAAVFAAATYSDDLERAEDEVAKLRAELDAYRNGTARQVLIAERDAERKTCAYEIDQRVRAEAKLAAVRAIHVKDEHYFFCQDCARPYPCPTIRALDGGQS